MWGHRHLRGSAPPATGTRPRGRGPAALLFAALTLGVAACGGGSADGPARALRFDGSAPDLEQLGLQVLSGLTRADEDALERLRLTEQEHNEVVWPELPASRPEVNYPLDLAWENIELRNRRGLDRITPLYRDRQLGFQRVECRGPTETFETFHVITDCWVVFTTDGGPELYEAQLFKDVLVRGGGLKIFRYYDEEPRRYAGGRSS